MTRLNTLDFVSVQVRDLDASRQFYTDVLGFMPVPEARPNAIVFRNEASGAIFAIRTPLRDLPAPAATGTGVSLWFNVADVAQIHQQVVANGGRVLSEPEAGPFGQQFMIADPDGYTIVFHQMPDAIPNA